MASRAPSDLRVERARRGDLDAFTDLLREHDESMRAIVYSMVRDRWSFKTWLHRICWTTAVDPLRQDSLRPRRPRLPSSSAPP